MGKKNSKQEENIVKWKEIDCPFCKNKHNILTRCPEMKQKIDVAKKKILPVSFWGNVLWECLKNQVNFKQLLEEISYLYTNQVIKMLAFNDQFSFLCGNRARSVDEFIRNVPINYKCDGIPSGIVPNMNDIIQYICASVGCSGSSLFASDKKKLKEMARIMLYEEGGISISESRTVLYMPVQFMELSDSHSKTWTYTYCNSDKYGYNENFYIVKPELFIEQSMR